MGVTPKSNDRKVMQALQVIVQALLFFIVVFGCLVSFRVVQYVYNLVRDYYTLWNIAFGSSPQRRQVSARFRLHCYVAFTRLFDAASVCELYAFLTDKIATDVPVEDFHQIVLSYKYAVLFREKMDGSLRGVMLFDKLRKDHAGMKYTIFRLGLAFFHPNYQGGPLLYYFLLYHTIKEAVLRPNRPLFVIGKLFSYKSYLGMVNSIESVYPQCGKETPEFEKTLINEFAESVRRPCEKYNAETFVLERELSCVKNFVSPISNEDLKNQHIRFFVERNPGWCKGHCMFFIAKIKWSDIFRNLWKAISRARAARKKNEQAPPLKGVNTTAKKQADKDRFRRSASFQTDIAKKYMIQRYEVDVIGGKLRKESTDIELADFDGDDNDVFTDIEL